jgi:hypothetical protein
MLRVPAVAQKSDLTVESLDAWAALSQGASRRSLLLDPARFGSLCLDPRGTVTMHTTPRAEQPQL